MPTPRCPQIGSNRAKPRMEVEASCWAPPSKGKVLPLFSLTRSQPPETCHRPDELVDLKICVFI